MASTSDVAQLLDADAVPDGEIPVVAEGNGEVELGAGLVGAGLVGAGLLGAGLVGTGLVGAGATRGRDVSHPVADSAADNAATTMTVTLRPADVIVTDL